MSDRAVEAATAAVSLYNRPAEEYRFEQFSILLCNAWELLLKARILQLNGNKFSSIAAYERRENADGSTSLKRYRKRTRSGTTMTIGLFKAYDRLSTDNAENLPRAVRKNLEAVVEIRDTAVHFMHISSDLVREQHEIFAAATDNFLKVLSLWFGRELVGSGPDYLPLAFLGSRSSIAARGTQSKLITYLRAAKSSEDAKASEAFSVGLRVTVDAKKSSDQDAANYRLTREPTAQALRIEEDDLRDRFPWTYEKVLQRCRTRYEGFKQNQRFHALMREAKKNPQLMNRRILDIHNAKSAGQDFYSPNLLSFLDSHWSRKQASRIG